MRLWAPAAALTAQLADQQAETDNPISENERQTAELDKEADAQAADLKAALKDVLAQIVTEQEKNKTLCRSSRRTR